MTITSMLTTGNTAVPILSNAVLHSTPAAASILLCSSVTSSSRVQRTPPSARSFWWSRRIWPTYPEPNFQKQAQRQHRILKHKYIRALRRHALWDRDPAHNRDRPTGWRLASSWYQNQKREDETGIPKKKSMEGEAENEPSNLFDEYKTRKDVFLKNFEEFKKRIDADPYGALFGRKLQRLCYHPKRDGWPSSWWAKAKVMDEDIDSGFYGKKRWRDDYLNDDRDAPFLETDHKKPEAKEAAEKMSANAPIPEKRAESPNKDSDHVERLDRTETIPRSQSTASEEFEFDPISMRKIPKKTASESKSTNASLNEEFDIPVKTFKSYRAQFEQTKPADNSEPDQAVNESTASRTASVEEHTPTPPSSKTPWNATPKVINLDPPSKSLNGDWLSREGFGLRPTQSFKDESKISPLPKYSVTPPSDVTWKSSFQSALDRVQSTSKPIKNESPQGHPESKRPAISEEELEGLRASDIRSSPKYRLDMQDNRSLEIPKHQEQLSAIVEECQAFSSRLDQWRKLTCAFLRRRRVKGVENDLSRLMAQSEEIESVLANLTKTMKLNKILSKEVKDQKVAMRAAESRDPRLRQMMPKKPKFFQENHHPFSPVSGFAKNVLEQEKKAKEIKEKEKERERELVRKIRAIYEEKYGVLDSRHRQLAAEEQVKTPEPAAPINVQQYKKDDHTLAREIQSIYEEKYGKLDSEHRQPGTDLVKPETPTMQPTQESETRSSGEIPSAEEPHVTPPEVEAQIIRELQQEAQAKKNAQTNKLQVDLEKTRRLPDETQAKLKLAELKSATAAEPEKAPFPKEQDVVATPSSPPTIRLYKVHVLNDSIMCVTSADEKEPLTIPPHATPSDVAKFGPFFKGLENAGYRVCLPSLPHALLFQKVGDTAESAQPSSVAPWEVELEENTSPNTSAPPPVAKSGAARTIKRTEPVFSGQSPRTGATVSGSKPEPSFSGSDGKKQRSKITMIFWTAVWTGGLAAAISVVGRFFRDGDREERRVEWLGGTRKQR